MHSWIRRAAAMFNVNGSISAKQAGSSLVHLESTRQGIHALETSRGGVTDSGFQNSGNGVPAEERDAGRVL